MTVQSSLFLQSIDHQKKEPHLEQMLFLGWMKKIFFCCMLLFISSFMTSCASKKTIINGLEEREANEIVVFLSSKGIDAVKIQTKSEGPGGGGGAPTFDISVDKVVATDAMSILNANGLPRRRPQKLLEIFSSGGLVPSEMQEKIRFQAGLAEQIAGTIRKIDGILDADIQLSFPEEDPLNPQNKKGEVTASVFIKHQGVLDDPNSQLATKIRRLVASSVQGLSFDNVTVISDKGRFADSLQSKIKSRQNSESELIKIWTIVLAKESVTRFQIIFFLCAFLFFISTSLAIWFFWKLLPIVRSQGGSLGSLFSLTPFSLMQHGVNTHSPDESFQEEEREKEEGTPKKERKKKAQENIESP